MLLVLLCTLLAINFAGAANLKLNSEHLRNRPMAAPSVTPLPPLPAGEAFTVSIPDLGQLTGIQSPLAGSQRFLGIPYGEDTIKTQFGPSVPRALPLSQNGPFDATQFGAGCFGHHNNDSPVNQSTDCLNLDVFAPYGANSNSKYPVEVFVHGGSYQEGSSAGPFGLYSAATMAASGIVRVSINYRLNVLGLLAIERELQVNADKVGYNITGNQMLTDVILALQWVQQYISYFGGDPSRVTLSGESAGAMTIAAMISSEYIVGLNLFQQVRMESYADLLFKPLSSASLFGMQMCQLVSCNVTNPSDSTSDLCDVSCLVNVPPQVAMSAWSAAQDDAYAFIVDYVLSGHILDALLGITLTVDPLSPLIPVLPINATFNPTGIPFSGNIMYTSNSGEAWAFTGLIFSDPLLSPIFSGILEVVYGIGFGFNETNAKAIAAQPRYNTTAYWDDRIPLSNAITDYLFLCSGERFLYGVQNNPVSNSTRKIFSAQYAHLLNASSILVQFGLPATCAEYVCHASELVGVTFLDSPLFAYTDVELAMFSQMFTAIVNFNKYGDPNGPSATSGQLAVPWPLWDGVNRNRWVINDTITTDNTQEICGFWDSIGSYQF